MLKENETVYYFLENYELRDLKDCRGLGLPIYRSGDNYIYGQELECESVIYADGRKEVTFKKVNTDEGGN